MAVISKKFNSFVWEEILMVDDLMKGLTISPEMIEDLVLQSFEEYAYRPCTYQEFKDLQKLSKWVQDQYTAYFYKKHFKHIGNSYDWKKNV